MTLKKLRINREWSQEQLAKMSGLSVRTIQRIESGQKASLESLKSLASVLEINISTFEQEINMIDKKSEKWNKLPLWVRLSFHGSNIKFWGTPDRKSAIRDEIEAVIFGSVLLLLGFWKGEFFIFGMLIIIFAYGLSLSTRLGDKHHLW